MATIQERLDRMQRDGEQTRSASLQQRLNRMQQDGERAYGGGPDVTLPTAQQGTVTLPRADQGVGNGGSAAPDPPPVSRSWAMPEWASAPSLSPLPGTRNARAVQEEIDGVDSAIRELKEQRDELYRQAAAAQTGGPWQGLGGPQPQAQTQNGPWQGLGGPGAGPWTDSRAQELAQQAGQLNEQIAQLESNKAGLREEWDQADQRQFAQLRQTPEFREAVDKAMSAPYGLGTVNSRNPSYDGVSRAMTYFQAMARGEEALAAAAMQHADIALNYMSEEQRDRLAYYVGMGDYDGAADYLNRIAPALNREQAKRVKEGLAGWAQEHPVQGTLTNITSWPLNIPGYFDNARQAAENLITGEDRQSTSLTAATGAMVGSGTTQGVQEAARTAATETFGSETAGEVAAFLAGTGLSIGQNGTQIALLGPYSLAGMSISAAGSATADALERGATPKQAFLIGTASGAIEAVTEKIPLENLFRLAKEGGGKGLKAAVIEVLKQMGTEAGEEMISEIAGNLVDAAVMGDSSEFQAYVRELQGFGLSKEEAEQQALVQFYLINVGLAGLGGAISGGVMSGGAMAFQQAGAYARQLNEGRPGAEQVNAAIEQATQAMAETGMFSQEAGQAAQEAVQSAQTAQDGVRQDGREITLPEQQDAVQGTQRAAEGQTEAAFVGRQSAGPSLQAEGNPHRASEGNALRGQLTPQPSVQTPQAAGQTAQTDARGAGTRDNSMLDQIRETARLFGEDLAQGRITEAQFDGAMDLIREQAGLMGLEGLDLPDSPLIRPGKDRGEGFAPTTEGGAYRGTDEFERTAAPDGQQLSGGDGGRVSGAGAGGQDGVLAESGPQRAADTGRAAVERQNTGRVLQLEAVSSRELGLSGGTDERTVRLLPESAWDGELRRTARKIRQETGLGVRFVLGGIQVTDSGGGVRRVRGTYSEGGIIVQADHLRVSPGQIADHEIFHHYAQQDAGLLHAVEDAIVERYGQEELDRILDTYIQNLRGIVDIPEAGTDLEFEQAYTDLKNEVFADAFAGINAFGTHAERYQGAVLDTLEDRGTAARPQSRENAQAVDRRTGPPEAYSIDYDQENRPFVTVEEDILEGVPLEKWVKTVKDNLRKKFPNGVTVGNSEIKIDAQSRGEMTYSQYTKKLMREHPQLYADKLRAINNADELLLASRDWVNEPLHHGRKDSTQYFARGTVNLRIGDSEYSADVVVATRKSGDMILYDLLNLKETTINEKRRMPRATHTTEAVADRQGPSDVPKAPAPSLVPAYTDEKTPDGYTQNRMLTDASEHSVAQSGINVKGQEDRFPWVGINLPGGEDFGQTRFSADEDGPVPDPDTLADGIMMNRGDQALDGSMLPTLAELQARRGQTGAGTQQENAGATANSDAAGQEQSASPVDTLPRKAQDYLERAERGLVNKIGELLSVPRSAQREFLQGIVRDISTEYLRTGQVSQETRDQLFERAYEQGVKVDREFYDNYKHVRDYLRSTPITVSQQVRGDITDYGAWRKSAFGTLRLVSSGGIGVDTAYMELQHMAPGLFPEDVTHPADQLRQILETAQGIRASERSLDEYYGPDKEEFKRWTRRDFDEAVADALGDLKQVKRYADERAQAGATVRVPASVQEAAALWSRIKGARNVYEKAAARNLLTQHDEIQVGRLLRGELELEHLDPARDNVKGITAVYEAKLEYEELAGSIREWNRQRKAGLRAQADGFLENANQWKDKKAGILYSRETMERNIRDIVPDRDLADRINRAYFQPVHEAVAKSNRAKNEYRDRVRDLKLSRKAAKGDAVSEAHAVQLLGEAEDNIRMLEQSQGRMEKRDGKTLQEWQAVVAKLWEESPGLDQEKIRGAVKEFRAIYDELFQQMNEARVRNGYEPVNYRQGYFPHFQPGGEGMMAQFGKALGIDTAVNSLPTTINGLTHTFKPGIQWFGNAQERLGFNTVYDAVEGFDRYIEGAADVIYQTDNIQALRALGAQARYRTGDDGLRQQVDAVRARTDISEADKQALIDEIHDKGKFALNNFVVELDEYTNLLANKKSRGDRDMEQRLGRNMYGIMKKLEGRVAANMVAVNPASWLTNFVPLTQGWASLDSGTLLKGMWDTLRAYHTDDGIVGMSSFLTNRRGSDPLVKTWSQSASAVLSSPMEHIDQFTADSLVRARYAQNLRQGLSEAAAMEEADAWAAGVMADRSKGATPTLFNQTNPVAKLFTQFQLEVNNQLSYLFKDLPRDVGKKGLAALCAELLKFFLGAYLFNDVYEYFIGRRPALDPLGILNDTVGDITGYELPNVLEMVTGAATGNMPSFETEKKDAYETAAGLAGSVAEELPFIGGILGGGRVPISSALPDWSNLAKAALNDGWSNEKRLATAGKELGNPLTYLALPFGGGQVKKIYQGLKAVMEGGSYTVDNQGNDILQYPVFNETPGDWLPSAAGAMVFGKSTLPTARDWAESGFKSLSAKETACYQGMTELGVPQRDAFELIRALGKVKSPEGENVAATEKAAYQKRKLLQEADISAEGKGVVYYTLLASDNERALMDGLAEGGADMGEAARVLMQLKDANALADGSKSAAKKKAVMGSSLSETEKDAVFQYVLGKDSKGAALSGQLTKAGLDKNSAAAVANALNGLTPEQGRTTVSDAQKWRAVLDTANGEADRRAALLAVMSDSARTRFKLADSFGIDAETWVRLKEALPQFDANENGSYSGKEIENAIDALCGNGALLAPWDKDPLRLSREEKAALWQLYTGNESGSGNPYSTRVGKQAAKALEEAKGREEK